MVEKRTCPVCKTNADACGYSAFGNFKGYYHWGCLAVALSDLVTELESQLARQAPVIEAAREYVKAGSEGEDTRGPFARFCDALRALGGEEK